MPGEKSKILCRYNIILMRLCWQNIGNHNKRSIGCKNERKKTIAGRLKFIRKTLNLTQKELSQKIDVSITYICDVDFMVLSAFCHCTGFYNGTLLHPLDSTKTKH